MDLSSSKAEAPPPGQQAGIPPTHSPARASGASPRLGLVQPAAGPECVSEASHAVAAVLIRRFLSPSRGGGGRRRRLGLPHPVFVSFGPAGPPARAGGTGSGLAGFAWMAGQPRISLLERAPHFSPSPALSGSLFLPARGEGGGRGIRLPKCVTRSSGWWGLLGSRLGFSLPPLLSSLAGSRQRPLAL